MKNLILKLKRFKNSNLLIMASSENKKKKWSWVEIKYAYKGCVSSKKFEYLF